MQPFLTCLLSFGCQGWLLLISKSSLVMVVVEGGGTSFFQPMIEGICLYFISDSSILSYESCAPVLNASV